jgi:carbon storage regulator
MLVLTRKRGEKIMIGSDIELIVVGMGGDRVRLAFKAPPEVAIYRKEIHLRMQEEHLRHLPPGALKVSAAPAIEVAT